jgi:hypothetical protein
VGRSVGDLFEPREFLGRVRHADGNETNDAVFIRFAVGIERTNLCQFRLGGSAMRVGWSVASAPVETAIFALVTVVRGHVGERREALGRLALVRRTRSAAAFGVARGHGALEVGTLVAGERLTALAPFHELAGFVKVNGLTAGLAVKRGEGEKQNGSENDAFHGVTSLPEAALHRPEKPDPRPTQRGGLLRTEPRSLLLDGTYYFGRIRCLSHHGFIGHRRSAGNHF